MQCNIALFKHYYILFYYALNQFVSVLKNPYWILVILCYSAACVFFLLLLLSNIFNSSSGSHYSSRIPFLNTHLSFVLSSPYLPLTTQTFQFADSELCDSSPGRGRVQHCSVAQKPREESQHGRSAA